MDDAWADRLVELHQQFLVLCQDRLKENITALVRIVEFDHPSITVGSLEDELRQAVHWVGEMSKSMAVINEVKSARYHMRGR